MTDVQAERIDLEAYGQLFDRFERSAWRLEAQREYDVAQEADAFARFLGGAREDGRTIPGLAGWFDWVAAAVASGRSVGRVRLYDEPPTGYQQYEAWVSQWNIAAGEDIRVMPRSRAAELALPVDRDWWLFDDRMVVELVFDGLTLIGADVTTAPDIVVEHLAWRDLAIRHSAPSPAGRIAA